MVKALRFTTDCIFYFGILLWVISSKNAAPVLTVLAVVIHELGHIIASLILGYPTRKFSFQAGGFKLSGERAYSSYFDEAAIAFAGPFFNLISALTFLSATDSAATFFRHVSFALAILNLLPITEFDGGRVLACILSSFMPCGRCERLCELLSFLSLFLLWCASVYLLLRSGRSFTLFIFSAFVFIRTLRNRGEYRINEIIRG